MPAASAATLALLPRPRRLSAHSGRYEGVLRVLRVHPDSANLVALRTRAAALGLRLQADPRRGMHSAVVGVAQSGSPPSRVGGYVLRIDAAGIAVDGSDARGLVWGLVTLAQILDQAPRPPALVIEDWPEYGIRYHHDDVSRKQVSTPKDFRRIIRHLSSFKISHYTLYLEDMVLIDRLPDIGEGRGAFLLATLRDLVEEGERWQVEVFPTLSLAGHQENLLRLPRYRGLGARTWQPPSSFDPRNPAVREHLGAVLDAVCPVFESRFFNMGFDELQGLDADSFADHLNWCAGELVKRGKTPLFYADMIYNHFGSGMLARLHKDAIPVAWDYLVNGGKARAAMTELAGGRNRAWVLGGYNNWKNFLHAPLAEAVEQWRNWRKVAAPGPESAFGAAQWGDDGYENHRDLAWPLFAACAEQGWSGDDGDESTVESRFQTVFHHHPLPGLTKLRRLLENGLALAPGRSWYLHRLPAPGWRRLARMGGLPSASRLATDAATLLEARRLLASCRRLALSEVGQLDHYGVVIDRLHAVNLRARAARGRVGIPAVLKGLAAARYSFREAWLAHNQPENIEVSLEVFAHQEASWQEAIPAMAWPPDGWHALDLGSAWNACQAGIVGVPIGMTMVAGVPFRFAPVMRTHAELAAGQGLSIPIPAVPLRDLHLVLSQPRHGEDRQPGARLRLLRHGRPVFEENLLAIRHLVDWWAPLGEHIWAGGGLAYADPQRVRWLLSPGAKYGICCVNRFPWPGAPVADRIELICLAGGPLQVFAITLEEAVR